MNVLHKADLRINAAEIKKENVRIYNFSDKKIPIGFKGRGIGIKITVA